MSPGSEVPPDETPRRPGYVLLVGPDTVERAPLEAALRGAGFEVMAATAAEVLASSDLVAPRLVVADLPEAAEARLPALQQLVGHRPLAEVPVLAIVPDRDSEVFRTAVFRGAATCLPKPVDAAALVADATRLFEWSPPPPEIDSRRHRRRPLLLDVEVSERETGLRVEGQMTEASSAGCRLELPVLLEPGRKVRIVLRPNRQATLIALGGEVRWAQKRDDGRGAAGIRFNGSTVLVAARELGFEDETDD